MRGGHRLWTNGELGPVAPDLLDVFKRDRSRVRFRGYS
jgi:hypothetical protein